MFSHHVTAQRKFVGRPLSTHRLKNLPASLSASLSTSLSASPLGSRPTGHLAYWCTVSRYATHRQAIHRTRSVQHTVRPRHTTTAYVASLLVLQAVGNATAIASTNAMSLSGPRTWAVIQARTPTGRSAAIQIIARWCRTMLTRMMAQIQGPGTTARTS